ncbi:MAG: cold shock domain-containing protein [Chromatiaceae bacterium]
MRGKITQWKDDRGFGFIVSDSGDEKIFFHISALKTQGRRPQAGDAVLYESMRDSQGRLKAKAVVIEGAVSGPMEYREKQIHTEPPRKNIVDYLSIALIIGALVGTAYGFFQARSVEIILPFGAILVVAIAVLNRQKKPKEKRFICARCKKTSEHDKRTIKAWNNGFLKLYCSVCHKKWLAERWNESQQASVASRGGGCLGVTIFLVALPVVTAIAVYQWVL